MSSSSSIKLTENSTKPPAGIGENKVRSNKDHFLYQASPKNTFQDSRGGTLKYIQSQPSIQRSITSLINHP